MAAIARVSNQAIMPSNKSICFGALRFGSIDTDFRCATSANLVGPQPGRVAGDMCLAHDLPSPFASLISAWPSSTMRCACFGRASRVRRWRFHVVCCSRLSSTRSSRLRCLHVVRSPTLRPTTRAVALKKRSGNEPATFSCRLAGSCWYTCG